VKYAADFNSLAAVPVAFVEAAGACATHCVRPNILPF
jgi:hypothetical protein